MVIVIISLHFRSRNNSATQADYIKPPKIAQVVPPIPSSQPPQVSSAFKPVPPPKPKNYRPPMHGTNGSNGNQWENGVSFETFFVGLQFNVISRP
jgi:hypothetical protein